MDIKKGNYYTEDRKKTINWVDQLSRHMGALDRFLRHIHKNKPELYSIYVKALEKRFHHLILTPIQILEILPFPKLQEIIHKCDELQKLILTYVFQLLEIPDSISSETIEIPWFNFDKSNAYPFYYRVLVLSELIGKQQAIEYVKNYTDEFMQTFFEADPQLDDLDQDWETEYPFEVYDPTDDIRFRLSKGIMGARVDECIKHDIMKPLNDPELSYVVCCYGEIAHTHAVRPHVVYTRTTSLIQGGPYCDNCFHDKRYVKNIKHPDKEFWESLS